MAKPFREKLEHKLADSFLQLMQREYHFVPRVEICIAAARIMINQYRTLAELDGKITYNQELEEAYARYYATTKLPEKEYAKHSAHMFKNFLYANYGLIFLKRFSWQEKLYLKVRRLLSKKKK